MSPLIPKPAHQLARADVVPGRGAVILVRSMGPMVIVKFADGSTKLYRRGTRVYL